MTISERKVSPLGKIYDTLVEKMGSEKDEALYSVIHIASNRGYSHQRRAELINEYVEKNHSNFSRPELERLEDILSAYRNHVTKKQSSIKKGLEASERIHQVQTIYAPKQHAELQTTTQYSHLSHAKQTQPKKTRRNLASMFGHPIVTLGVAAAAGFVGIGSLLFNTNYANSQQSTQTVREESSSYVEKKDLTFATHQQTPESLTQTNSIFNTPTFETNALTLNLTKETAYNIAISSANLARENANAVASEYQQKLEEQNAGLVSLDSSSQDNSLVQDTSKAMDEARSVIDQMNDKIVGLESRVVEYENRDAQIKQEVSAKFEEGKRIHRLMSSVNFTTPRFPIASTSLDELNERHGILRERGYDHTPEMEIIDTIPELSTIANDIGALYSPADLAQDTFESSVIQAGETSEFAQRIIGNKDKQNFDAFASFAKKYAEVAKGPRPHIVKWVDNQGELHITGPLDDVNAFLEEGRR